MFAQQVRRLLARVATLVALVMVLPASGACGLIAGAEENGVLAKAAGAAGPGKPAPASASKDTVDAITLRGRVVGFDGKPVAGARLYLSFPTPCLVETFGMFTAPPQPRVRATTGRDGRFQFVVDRPEIDVEVMGRRCFGLVTLLAMGPDGGSGPSRFYGLDFEPVFVFDASGRSAATTLEAFPEATGLLTAKREPVLRLVEDSAPLTGRIVDGKGQAVAGATVTVREVWTLKNDDLTGLLNAVTNERADYDRARDTFKAKMIGGLFRASDLERLLAATTDREGRFRLVGIGRERIVSVVIQGPRIEPYLTYAYTRPGPAIDVVHSYGGTGTIFPSGYPGTFRFYGSGFQHKAFASIPLLGTVRDRDTGKPLAGVRIQRHTSDGMSHADLVWDVSDERGCYRLNGLPVGKESKLLAVPRLDQPYLSSLRIVDLPVDGDSVKLDITLKRGVWLRGRVAEETTGRPVRAFVHYYAFVSNPHLGSVPDFHGAVFGQWSPYMSDKEGCYAIPGLPGRGLVGVFALDDSRFPRGVGAKAITAGRRTSQGELIEFETAPGPCISVEHHAMAEVDPAADAEGMVRDFQLDPGRTLHGKVLDPEGRPLAGANCRGLSPHSGAWLLLGSEDFMVRQYRPDAPRVVQFYHKERKLAGWQVVQGSQQSPITVRLQPWGVLTGRIVDTQGKPMAKILLKGGDGGNRNDPAIADLLPELYSFTDENGGFRIEGLAPGMKYNVVAEAGGNVVSNLSVAPGETKDLGEVRLAAVTSRVKELQERVMKMEQEALQRARAKKKAKD